MKKYTLKAAPAASAKELKDQKAPKAKRILVGSDTHLRGYQARNSTLERRAPVLALGCLSPLVDWARSFLLSDAYLASCAVNT
jgi:hypothetical protein